MFSESEAGVLWAELAIFKVDGEASVDYSTGKFDKLDKAELAVVTLLFRFIFDSHLAQAPALL